MKETLILGVFKNIKTIYVHSTEQFQKWKKKVHRSTMENTKNTPVNTRLIDHTCV